MKRILFVDDEPKILTGLRRMLRSFRREWEMVFAEGGAEALDQCASGSFDVIVSDARMPHMEGSQLFAEVMRLYPETVRMILSGQCSRRSVLQCVGVAHQFLSKPCDPETLKSALRRMCEMRDSFRDRATRRAVSSVQSLPSRPGAYAELVDCAESPAASIDQVAEIIGRDVAMFAKTMQLVSSGFFGTPQRVADAADAARLLGLDTIKALLASSAAFVPGDPKTFCEEGLQAMADHCLAVAVAAKRIAGTVTSDRTLIGDAYVAGMLHEVGALALEQSGAERRPGSYGATAGARLADPRSGAAGSGDARPDPGGYLAALWGLPDPIVHAIGHHRAPGNCSQPTFGPITAVHAAHAFLEQLQDPPSEAASSLDMDYLRRTGCADRLKSWREICASSRPEGVLQ